MLWQKHDLEGPNVIFRPAKELTVDVDCQRRFAAQAKLPTSTLANLGMMRRWPGQGKARQEAQHFPARKSPGMDVVEKAVVQPSLGRHDKTTLAPAQEHA